MNSTNIGFILFGKFNVSILGYNIKKNVYENMYTRKFTKEITHGIYLPKKKWLALATVECKVELFQLEIKGKNDINVPNKPLFSLYGHSLPINTITTDIEETLMFTGSMDKSMKIFNLQFGDLIKTCIGHKEEITKIVCFGDYIITASRDRKLIVWGLKKYKLLKEIKTLHLGDVWDIDATPDMLITACEDRCVRSIPYELLEDFLSIKEENHFKMELEDNIETNKFVRFNNVKTKVSSSLKWKAVYLQNFISNFYDEIVVLSSFGEECKPNTTRIESITTPHGTNNIAHYKTAMKIQQNDSLFNKIISSWNFSELDELFRATSHDFKNKLFNSMMYCYNENHSNITLNYSFIFKKYFENNKRTANKKEKELLKSIDTYLVCLNQKLTKTVVLSEMI